MELIHKYFPGLSPEQKDQLSALGNLYINWNTKINLISRKDIPHLYERHILHSISIAKYFPFPGSSKIMDVGTGGGFPGIPLAIMFPGSEFTLVDSIGKKIKVVNDIITTIQLKNCRAIHSRAEQINDHFNFIVSRAVTNFSSFVKMVKGKVSQHQISGLANGIIYLKGGDFEEEIKYFRKSIRVYSISDLFEEEYFLTKKIIYLEMKLPAVS